jgi:hypothetical protein
MKRFLIIVAVAVFLGVIGCAGQGPAVYGVPNTVTSYQNFNVVDIYMYGYPRHKSVLIPKKGKGTLRFNYSLSYMIRERVVIRYADGEVTQFDYQQDKRY